MTLALKHATDSNACDRKFSLPVGILRFALDQSHHDLLVGLVLAEGIAELPLGLEHATDAGMRDGKISLKMGIFGLAPGQPQHDSFGGLVSYRVKLSRGGLWFRNESVEEPLYDEFVLVSLKAPGTAGRAKMFDAVIKVHPCSAWLLGVRRETRSESARFARQ